MKSDIRAIIYALAVISLCTLFSASAQTAVQAWVQRYNGPTNNRDEPNAIGVDTNGNVSVSGYSVVSGMNADFAVIKYTGAGLPLWTNRYNGSAGVDDAAYAGVVDGNGNVLVAGYSGSNFAADYATVLYSNAGVPLWTNRYNGPGSGADYVFAVALDGGGNAFVTGHSTGSGSFYDIATIKYSSVGTPLWTNRYNGPANNWDRANAIAVDSVGNVFVTGFTYTPSGPADYVTIKYSDAGGPVWTNRYNGPANNYDAASAVVVDAADNVVVTGSSYGVASAFDYVTIKYSNAGVPLWTNYYDGPGNSWDQPTALAVDGSGNVFVTGYSANTNTSPYDYDYSTIAYSSAGVAFWTNRYNGTGNGEDRAKAIGLDASGNVFVTGFSSNGNNTDYATISYSNVGVPLWTNIFNGLGNGDDGANAIAVDFNGDVFVTGYSSGIDSGYDFVTIKYSIVHQIFLAIQPMNNQVVLSWTNPAFGLQAAAAITGTFTTVSGASSPYTNPITGAQQFFRLISN